MAQRYNPAGAPVTRTAPRPGHRSPDPVRGDRPVRRAALPAGGDGPQRRLRRRLDEERTTTTGNYLYEIEGRVFTPPARPLPATSPLPRTTIRSGKAPPSRWTRAALGGRLGGRRRRPPTTSTPSGAPSAGPAPSLNARRNPLLVNTGTRAPVFAVGGQATLPATSRSPGTRSSIQRHPRAGGLRPQVQRRRGAQGGDIHVNTTTTQNQGSSKIAMTRGRRLHRRLGQRPDRRHRRPAATSSPAAIRGRHAATGEVTVNANTLGFQGVAGRRHRRERQRHGDLGEHPRHRRQQSGQLRPPPQRAGRADRGGHFRIATLTGTDEDDPAVAVDGQGDVFFRLPAGERLGDLDQHGIFAERSSSTSTTCTDAQRDLGLDGGRGAGQQTVNLAGIAPGGGESQTITVTAASTVIRSQVVPTPSVTYTSPSATGTLALHAFRDRERRCDDHRDIMDNGGTANGRGQRDDRTFKVTVIGKPTANSQSASTLLNTATAVTLTGSDPTPAPDADLHGDGVSHPTARSAAPPRNSPTRRPPATSGPTASQFKVNNGRPRHAVATVSLTVGRRSRSPPSRSTTAPPSGPRSGPSPSPSGPGRTLPAGSPTPWRRSPATRCRTRTNVANLAAAVSTNGSGRHVVKLTFTTTGNAAAEVTRSRPDRRGRVAGRGRFQFDRPPPTSPTQRGRLTATPMGPPGRQLRHPTDTVGGTGLHLGPTLRRCERGRCGGRHRPGPVPQHVTPIPARRITWPTWTPTTAGGGRVGPWPSPVAVQRRRLLRPTGRRTGLRVGGLPRLPANRQTSVAEVRDRLATLDRLPFRKYGKWIDDVLVYGEEIRSKISQMENKDQLLHELKRDLAAKASGYLDLARGLSRKRFAAARKLEKTVEAEINDLAMKARFSRSR